MPELPEVETVVRELRPLLVGRSFMQISVSRKALRTKWSRAWKPQLLGKRVAAIQRRGKWILMELAGRASDERAHPSLARSANIGCQWLVVHLGMTGQFTVAEGPRETHTHVVFTLDDGRELRFRDVRRFGSVTFYPNHDALEASFAHRRLGPEPFDLSSAMLHDALRSTARNLKAFLLDQSVIAGVGNIYADESLFEARMHPARLGRHVTFLEADALRQAIVRVLTRAIECRGSSIRDYIGGSGLKGQMQDEFRVYGRTGQPCLRCGASIQRIILAQRSTHYCPKCQRKRK